MNANCANCRSSEHHTGSCPEPNRIHCCPRCPFTSIDGNGHTSPCFPHNTVSGFRSNVYAITPKTLFKLRVKNQRGSMLVLNGEIGKFVSAPNDILFSPATEGILDFKKPNDNLQMITYRAASVKRFSVILCVLNKKLWRMRARLVVTQYEGVLGFKMFKTMYQDENGCFQIADEFKNNTAVIIGMKSESEEIKFELRINTSDNGIQTDETGYFGNIIYNRVIDQAVISPELLPENATRRLFPTELYEQSGRHVPVSSIRNQHVSSEVARVVEEFSPPNVNVSDDEGSDLEPVDTEANESVGLDNVTDENATSKTDTPKVDISNDNPVSASLGVMAEEGITSAHGMEVVDDESETNELQINLSAENVNLSIDEDVDVIVESSTSEVDTSKVAPLNDNKESAFLTVGAHEAIKSTQNMEIVEDESGTSGADTSKVDPPSDNQETKSLTAEAHKVITGIQLDGVIDSETDTSSVNPSIANQETKSLGVVAEEDIKSAHEMDVVDNKSETNELQINLSAENVDLSIDEDVDVIVKSGTSEVDTSKVAPSTDNQESTSTVGAHEAVTSSQDMDIVDDESSTIVTDAEKIDNAAISPHNL